MYSKEETFNTITHILGIIFTLSIAWYSIYLGYSPNATWKDAFGVTFFVSGMLLMFLSSSLYHWVKPGKAKRCLRIFDHISIYIMIAASYTPICVSVVGGTLGWIVFGLLWSATIIGMFFKIFALGKNPKVSLILYLVMGWSIVLIAEPVFTRLNLWAIIWIILEGVFYTSGTYFFAKDSKPYYHGIWHIFVLAGAISHQVAIISILRNNLEIVI